MSWPPAEELTLSALPANALGLFWLLCGQGADPGRGRARGGSPTGPRRDRIVSVIDPDARHVQLCDAQRKDRPITDSGIASFTKHCDTCPDASVAARPAPDPSSAATPTTSVSTTPARHAAIGEFWDDYAGRADGRPCRLVARARRLPQGPPPPTPTWSAGRRIL